MAGEPTPSIPSFRRGMDLETNRIVTFSLNARLISVETAFFFLAGLVCLAWVGYCVKKGRTYSGHLGWHTREEWPKLFWFELLFPAAIGLGMLVFSIKTLLGY